MNQQPQGNNAIFMKAESLNKYPINHYYPQSIEQATAAKRGLEPDKSGILRKPRDPVAKCYQ